MADLITRLKVDSQEYDAKIRRAAESLKHMEAEVRRTGASFAYADKAEVEYMKSLGNMATQSSSAKGQLRELTDAINDMTVTYRNLTDEEKSSQFGQALQASMGQLKERAAVLRDQMDDLNQELKHMASDTSFADGMNLMTSTIGSCASAVVAWSGDGKEMEEVIKSLAKIQTTVKAVEALTKAFQKQNLVMLKNPYVAAAAAVAALGVAIYEFCSKETEAEKANKRLAESMKEMNSAVGSAVGGAVSQYNALRMSWMQLSDESEKNAWLEENKSKLEGLGLAAGDVNAADDIFIKNSEAYVDALKKRAKANAMMELYQKKMKAAYEENEGLLDYDRENSNGRSIDALSKEERAILGDGDKGTRTTYDEYGSYDSTILTEQGAAKINKYREEQAKKAYDAAVARAEAEANKIYGSAYETANAEANAAEAGLKNMTKNETKSVKASNKNVDADKQMKIDLAEAERLARQYIEESIDPMLKARRQAIGMEFDLQFDLSGLDEAEDEAEIAMADAFQSGSLDDLKNKLAEATAYMESLTVDTEEWKNALDDVVDAQDALNAAQKKVNGGGSAAVDNANDTGDAWRNAVAAVNNVGNALQQIEDPAAKVSGIVMQAVANIALGFAQAAASPATGAAGVFGWIAAATAGLATMTATIASIKSATSGYAEGGLILPNGSPYQGDNIVARLNAGEGVLTADGIENAGRLASQTNVGSGMLGLRTEISGENIAVVLDNNNRRRGRSKSVR